MEIRFVSCSALDRRMSLAGSGESRRIFESARQMPSRDRICLAAKPVSVFCCPPSPLCSEAAAHRRIKSHDLSLFPARRPQQFAAGRGVPHTPVLPGPGEEER